MNLRGLLKYVFHRDTTHHGEFKAMMKLAGPDCPKIFVDVGANDGFYGSNSFPFVARGWRTLLIEPHPGAFKKLQERHAGRKNVTFLNLACSDAPGELPLWIGKDGDAGTLATLCDFDQPGQEHLRTGESVKVKVVRLSDLLAEQQIRKDFGIISIDAERMDYEVLVGLDLSIWRPRVIITEDYAPKDAVRNEYMRQHRYKHAAQCNVNSLWVPDIN